MNRHYDWSPLAGSDPIPGDPARVAAWANANAEVATRINEAYANLNRLTNNWTTISLAVDKFREKAVVVQFEILRVKSRYSEAASALSNYSAALQHAQSDSLELLRQAKEADQTRQDAQYRAQHHDHEVQQATDPVAQKTAQLNFNRQVAKRNAANSRIADLKARLQNVIHARDVAAETAKSALLDAEANSAIKSEGWTDRAVDTVKKGAQAVGDVVKAIGDAIAKVGKWIWDHLDEIALVLTVVSIIAMVFCPALVPALAILARAANLAANVKKGIEAADTAYKVLTKQITPEEGAKRLALAGLTMLAGKGVGKLAKNIGKTMIVANSSKMFGVSRAISYGMKGSAKGQAAAHFDNALAMNKASYLRGITKTDSKIDFLLTYRSSTTNYSDKVQDYISDALPGVDQLGDWAGDITESSLDIVAENLMDRGTARELVCSVPGSER